MTAKWAHPDAALAATLRTLTVQEIDDLQWAVRRFEEYTQADYALRDLKRLDRLRILLGLIESSGCVEAS